MIAGTELSMLSGSMTECSIVGAYYCFFISRANTDFIADKIGRHRRVDGTSAVPLGGRRALDALANGTPKVKYLCGRDIAVGDGALEKPW